MDPRSRRETGYDRPLVLPGRATSSRWGFDAVLECYWAEVHQDAAGAVRIGPEHLLVTLGSLARAVAAGLGLTDQEVYLALLSGAGPAAPEGPAVPVGSAGAEVRRAA